MLDRYVIVERIAVGGMGEVFVARQEGVGNFRRTVVLKKLLPDAEGSDEAAVRLLDEARINASLSHENVVTIIEVGTGLQNGAELPWLALEYVHGENCGTLRTKAGKRGITIPIVVAAQIVKDSARGLHHAHNASDVDGRPMNIIHRDIAPKNIFVRHDGVSKVGDFGIARADARMSHTATGAIAGTLTYMSPEQLSSKEMTPLSDQFALGIVFWELLTGRRLFKGEGPVETAEKILSGKIRPPSRYRPDLNVDDASAAFGKELDAIVLRMLQRDPKKRFPDCGEVAAAIEAVVKDTASSVGRAAVAAFVEEMVGPELRERQKRIEEGAEQTVASSRPKAWDDPSSSRKNADAAAAAGVAADVDAAAANANVEGDPTVRDRAPPVDVVKPITRPTRETRPTPALPAAQSWSPPQRSRAPLFAAVVVGFFAVGVVVAGVATGRFGGVTADDPDRLMREHLHDAQRVNPLTFREAVAVYAVEDEVDAKEAEKLADDLTALMRERLALVVTHWDKPPAARDQERVDVRTKERAILDRFHKRLAAVGDKEDLKNDLLDIFQDDSSVPIRFNPPLTLEQIQARVYPNGIQLMNDSREERWDKTARLARRAGVDPAVVRAKLEPLVLKRERLLEKFGTAEAAALGGIEAEEEAVADAGRKALVGVVADDYAAAIANVAFIPVPSSKKPTPEIDQNADTNAR